MHDLESAYPKTTLGYFSDYSKNLWFRQGVAAIEQGFDEVLRKHAAFQEFLEGEK